MRKIKLKQFKNILQLYASYLLLFEIKKNKLIKHRMCEVIKKQMIANNIIYIYFSQPILL